MSNAAERAADRIRRFGQRRPEALRLARYASLAVRLDAPLLRALRLDLMPQSDAGIEADLWFSSLTESMSSQGFVLDGHVAEQLRRELAAEVVDGEQEVLNRVAVLTAAAHSNWPVSLQLEERITWLALQRTDGPAAVEARRAEIESLLRQLVKAMAQDETRGMEVARWVHRALGRLPQVARETEAALLLALGAAERLGGNIRFSGVMPASLPQDAAWILPSRQFSNWTTLGLRRYLTGIEFLESEGAPLTVTLPRTNPLYLQVSWLDGSKQVTQTISVAAGRTVAIPTTATEVRLRTLAGEELALEGTAQSTVESSPLEQIVKADELRQAIVRVESANPERAQFETGRMGFFVARDMVVSLLVRDDRAPREQLLDTEWHVVLPGGERVRALVVASAGEPFDTAVLRLEREVPGAVILPRNGNPEAVSPGMSWETTIPRESSSKVISGLVVAVDVHVADGLGKSRKGMIHLGMHRDEPAFEPDMLGAPVIVDGKIVAQIADQDGSYIRDCFARPIADVEPLLRSTLSPAEEEPGVFVSYAARDYRKGVGPDAEAIERIKQSMQVVGVRPLLDVELPLMASNTADFVAAIKASRGGALLITPFSHIETAVTEVEWPLLGYWHWAKPDFPVVVFRAFTGESSRRHLDARIPANFRDVAAADIDQASDVDLVKFAQRHFASLRLPRDEANGLELMHARAATLISGKGGPPGGSAAMTVGETFYQSKEGDTARSLMSHGMSADIPWKNLLAHLDQPAARELVDIAAAFSLPVETHRPLLYATVRNAETRAFCINAMPVNVAHALLRRAWIGQAVPRSIVFRDQSWESLPVGEVVTRVFKTVADALECDYDLARWLIDNAEAPLILIFATRPLPSEAYIDGLLAALPHAILFFLRGHDPRPVPPSVVELRGLGEGDDSRFIVRYKELMEMVASRSARRHRKAARSKKSSTARTRTGASARKPPATGHRTARRKSDGKFTNLVTPKRTTRTEANSVQPTTAKRAKKTTTAKRPTSAKRKLASSAKTAKRRFTRRGLLKK